MAGFGFSVGDVVAIGNFAWTVYKSCKNSGDEFRSITKDVNLLQSELHELSDEASNPSSLIHRCSKSQRDELKALLKSCKSDLRDLEKVLAKYNSLKTADPRMRDRFRFSTERQKEMRVKLSSHSDRLNLFLTHLNSGSLGRIEANQEMHTATFGEIKAKLVSIHNDVRTGKRNPTLLTSMEDWGTLENELVGDNITEVDVELNRDKIGEWLKQTREERAEAGQGQKRAEETSRCQAAKEDANDEDIERGSIRRVGGDTIDDDVRTSMGFEMSIPNTVIHDSLLPSGEPPRSSPYQPLLLLENLELKRDETSNSRLSNPPPNKQSPKDLKIVADPEPVTGGDNVPRYYRSSSPRDGICGTGDDFEMIHLSSTINQETLITVQKPLPRKLKKIRRCNTKLIPVTSAGLFYGITLFHKCMRKTYDNIKKRTRTEEICLQVPIKRGSRAGDEFWFKGMGDQTLYGTQDLRVVVAEAEHPPIHCEGDNVRSIVDISLEEALKGWHRLIFLQGKYVHVEVPGPTQPTWRMRFPGLGMPKFENLDESGDFILDVCINFPTSLTAEQERALDEIL